MFRGFLIPLKKYVQRVSDTPEEICSESSDTPEEICSEGF
jgi:hypothetical protein